MNVYTTPDDRGWMKTCYLKAQALDATNPPMGTYMPEITYNIVGRKGPGAKRPIDLRHFSIRRSTN
jgi:hypothetical protein